MKSVAILLPLVVALSACEQPRDVTVARPWVRLAAVPGNPSAAYFTLTGGAKDETLTGVATTAAMRAEMHESMSTGGMMSMTPVKLVAVRGGSIVTFAPGGKHVMLFGLKIATKAGSTIPLTFSFASGRTLTTDAKVVGPGDEAPGE